jgi:hypothetical protein
MPKSLRSLAARPWAAAVAMAAALGATPAIAADPGHVDAYVTPYYDSSGPAIRVGKYSAGLASKDRRLFVATIQRMKQHWSALDFVEAYVGAIRLYDLGYRNEAAYWFYSAQYRGRLFALLVDRSKMGGMGAPGFELYHAQNAFFQLVGPSINGFAFGNIDRLVPVIRKVQSENRTVPSVTAIYPGVAFVGTSQWSGKNAELNAGLGTLAESLPREKDQIERQRSANGTAARYAHVTSEPFPGGL